MRPGDDGYINVPEGESMMALEGDCCVNYVIQLADGRLASGSGDNTLRIWDTVSGRCMMTLEGHTSCMRSVIQLTYGRLVTCSHDSTLRIWNIMSLSQQKWIRRRLLVLLFEASKILSEPLESAVIHSEQYHQRRLQDLELLLISSLNISNDICNLKVSKIILTVLCNSDIVQLIAAFL